MGHEIDYLINPKEWVDGNRVKETYLVRWTTEDEKTRYLNILQSIYDAEYLRENESQKISMLKWTPRLTLPTPKSGGAFSSPGKNSPTCDSNIPCHKPTCF
jgi:hypothetical protein